MSSRRSFLTTSTATLVGSFALSQFKPSKVSAQSVGLNSNILAASHASHITATANV